MKKSELLSKLKSQKITVKFTKLDGSERTMVCTQSLEMIPTEQHPKGIRKTQTEAIAVYDLEAKGWRSFNFGKLLSVES